MVNPEKVLEHIALTTKKSIEEVKKEVRTEHWKDMISFSGQEGIDLFAAYAKGLKITEIMSLCSSLGFEVPIQTFHPDDRSHVKVKFYLAHIYNRIFRKKYEKEFNFPRT